jgi:potassium efflux system protein
MTKDYASVILQFPLFEGMTSQEAQKLLEQGSICHFAAGEIVFLEGTAPNSVLLVLEGELEVFVTRNKRDGVLTTQTAGSIVGELAVLCGIRRSASVRALEASTVLKWPAEAFAGCWSPIISCPSGSSVTHCLA